MILEISQFAVCQINNIRNSLVLIFMLFINMSLYGKNVQEGDSIIEEEKVNLYQRIKRYFDDTNKSKDDKRFDFSLIGGPHYSSDTKLGLGIVAAGIYRSSMRDTITSTSNVSLYGDICTSGFYMLGIRGNHLFPSDRSRIDYDFYFYSFPTKFWGVGYESAIDNHNEIEYDDFRFQLKVDAGFRIAEGLYLGPSLTFDKIKAKKVKDIEKWGQTPRKTIDFGIGGKIIWDTRDNLTAPKTGCLAGVGFNYYPLWLGNESGFSLLDLQFNNYCKLWKYATLATRLHARLGYGNVPWTMLPSFGGSMTMRGYYEGRFRDKKEMDITVELRQRVWRRSGMVIWVGCGNVCDKISDFRFSHVLPNVGIGYRWEFKKNTNVRLDFGIGKKQTGFIFNINEAF